MRYTTLCVYECLTIDKKIIIKKNSNLDKQAAPMDLLSVIKSPPNHCYSSRQKMFPKHFLLLQAQRRCRF